MLCMRYAVRRGKLDIDIRLQCNHLRQEATVLDDIYMHRMSVQVTIRKA